MAGLFRRRRQLGDTLSACLTFDGLREFSVWQVMVGNIDSAHLNDTGILYLIKTMGLWGLFIGIFFIPAQSHGIESQALRFFR
jgi:hypothetical protein